MGRGSKIGIVGAHVATSMALLAVLSLGGPALAQGDDAAGDPPAPANATGAVRLPQPSGDAADGEPPAPNAKPAQTARAAAEPAAVEQDASQAASQVASFAVTELKASPAVVTAISGEEIRNVGARDLVDILMLVPGFFVGADTLGVVGPGFRGLWGHEGKILLMIDGKEMNELLFSSMQLGSEFPVELIERVEVVRGPGSVIYGGSAELAVINVVTRSLQGATDVNVTATYGQLPGARAMSSGHARRRLTLSGRYVFDSVPGLSMFASASVGQAQRSARLYTDNVGTAVSLEGNSALDPAVLQMGVGYKDFQASLLYHRMATTTISGFGPVLPAAIPVKFDAVHGELIGAIRPAAGLEIVPRFNLTYQLPWRAPAETEDAYYDKSVRRLRGRLLGRWAALEQLQITAGGDAIFDHAQLEAPVGSGLQVPFGASSSVDYRIVAGYVELFSENPIVTAAAGARYDHHSAVGGALVPRVVLLRTLGKLSLKGLFSLSFRGPGIENINLGMNIRPERTRVFEFEGAVDLTPQQRLSANVFDMTIDAPIAYAAESYLNLGRQGTRGVEASYRLRAPFARLEVNYSFYVPSVSRDVTNYVVPGHREQFLAAPAHRGSFRANIRPWEGVGISPSVIIIGPHYTRGAPDADGGGTAVEIPAQVLANLFLYVDNVGTRGLRLGVGIYNLLGANHRFVRAAALTPAAATPAAALDAYQADHAPLPGLDREVMLQLSYALEAL